MCNILIWATCVKPRYHRLQCSKMGLNNVANVNLIEERHNENKTISFEGKGKYKIFHSDPLKVVGGGRTQYLLMFHGS